MLLGWEFPVDGYYLHSFEIWLATTVVFYGSGNLGFTLLEYRLGERDLLWAVLMNIKWIPFLYVLSLPVFNLKVLTCCGAASSSSAGSRSP